MIFYHKIISFFIKVIVENFQMVQYKNIASFLMLGYVEKLFHFPQSEFNSKLQNGDDTHFPLCHEMPQEANQMLSFINSQILSLVFRFLL
jgi:hypothetical protein